MSHANRGNPLERALVRGAQHYRRAHGRKVVLVKQHTPMHQTDDGGLAYSDRGAPVDMIGGIEGHAWGVEAKETAVDRFPLEDRKQSQREALRVLWDCDFIIGLVIDFTARGEVYLIWWPAVAAFEAAPWRRSLSLDWCRVHGLLLPELKRGSEDDRATLFLEGAPHPDRAVAVERMEADRAASKPLTEDRQLCLADERDRRWAERMGITRTRGLQPITPEEARERIMRATQEGIERQLKTAGRPKPGQRFQWRGGGRGRR
jgi:penicillin-binding protein-related factor A (putative recombinase)